MILDQSHRDRLCRPCGFGRAGDVCHCGRPLVKQVDFLRNPFRLAMPCGIGKFFEVGEHKPLVRERFMEDWASTLATLARCARKWSAAERLGLEPRRDEIERCG